MSVVCKICDHSTKSSLQGHLRHQHNLLNKEYLEKYPDAIIYSKAYGDRLRYTNAHRDPAYKKVLSKKSQDNWKDPEKRESHCRALKKGQNSPEAIEKHRQGALNHFQNRSKEQEELHVQGIIESWKDPVKRQNRITGIKKANKSEKVIKNRSIARKNYLNSLSDEEKIEYNENLKKTWAKPENRKKLMELSRIGLKAARSPEGRKNMRLGQIKRFSEGKTNRSRLNIKMEVALKKSGLYPESEFVIGYYIVDFCFPDKKLVVEADGDWWHCNPKKKYKKIYGIQSRTMRKDRSENTYLKNHGWTVLRFWEMDINKDINFCIQKIKKELGELCP